MSTTTGSNREQDLALADAIFKRIAEDLAMVIDRKLEIDAVATERATSKPEVKKIIHISFRFCVAGPGVDLHGCLLVPLPDAISLAAYLMMVPDDGVKTRRSDRQLDRGTKDAMLEVGNFIGGATDAALRQVIEREVKSKAEGCQGIAIGAKPAFIYAEGSELIVATAKAQIHTWPSFDLVLLLPPLPPPQGA